VAQFLRGPDRKIRVPQVFPADDCEIRSTVSDDLVGPFGGGDLPDGADR